MFLEKGNKLYDFLSRCNEVLKKRSILKRKNLLFEEQILYLKSGLTLKRETKEKVTTTKYVNIHLKSNYKPRRIFLALETRARAMLRLYKSISKLENGDILYPGYKHFEELLFL